MEKILNNNNNLSQKKYGSRKKKNIGVREANIFFFSEKSLKPSCSSQTKNIPFEYIKHIDLHKSFISSSSLAVYAQRCITAAIRRRNPATKAEERVYTVLITLGAKNISYEIMPLLTRCRERALFLCYDCRIRASQWRNHSLKPASLMPAHFRAAGPRGGGGGGDGTVQK